MIFDEIIDELKQKKSNKEQGIFNGIPNPFERHSEYFPSIDKGSSIGILGSTGIGKSKFVRDFAVYHPFKFHLETGYPVKILYLPLEDPKHSVYKKIITRFTWERHNITLISKYLESKQEPLSDIHLKLIRDDRKFYEKLEDTVYIYNDAITPKSIRNACHKFYNNFGKDNHLIVVIDNYSNITKENGKHNSDWDAIRELSREIIRLDLCKEKQMTVFSVLQEDFDQQKYTARNAGKASISALEPNLSSVGAAKVVTQDLHDVFALFYPWRYEIKEYMGGGDEEGYRIDVMRNRFRSLLHLKSNNGEVAPRLGLYFDGLRETYREMPLTKDKEALADMYNKIIQETKEKQDGLFGKKGLF